eukprot:TRINITY_DN31994_c0_g1_i1.p1 TRINITY_DN31994_c0_g1~~TRINITY_DN31994_c0_g1_i1.p1  ORF type:complete len:289 (+),score=71.44 TRINITY_DN31994_c0_g1_i1:172-1038(+)
MTFWTACCSEKVTEELTFVAPASEEGRAHMTPAVQALSEPPKSAPEAEVPITGVEAPPLPSEAPPPEETAAPVEAPPPETETVPAAEATTPEVAEAAAVAEETAAEPAATDAAPEAVAPPVEDGLIYVDVVSGPEGLGLSLDTSDPDRLIIKGSSKSLSTWNVQHSCEVKFGDALVSVNGNIGSQAELVDFVKSNTNLRLGFKRPTIRSIQITKAGRPLGLSLEATSSLGLLVKAILPDGVVGSEGLNICKGDRIVSANGVECSNYNAFMERLSKDNVITLKLYGYSS